MYDTWINWFYLATQVLTVVSTVIGAGALVSIAVSLRKNKK